MLIQFLGGVCTRRRTYAILITLLCLTLLGIFGTNSKARIKRYPSGNTQHSDVIDDSYRKILLASKGHPADKNDVFDIEDSNNSDVKNAMHDVTDGLRNNSLSASDGRTNKVSDVKNAMHDVTDGLRNSSLLARDGKKLGLYIISHGRLGNNLFQYASLYVLSRLTGRTPFWLDGWGPFHTGPSIYDSFPNLSIQRITHLPAGMKPITKIPLPGINYTSELLNIRNSTRDYLLCCYANSLFDNTPIFSGFENDILLEFAFNKKHINQSQMFLRNSIRHMSNTSNVLFVGTHVRRGDVLNLSKSSDKSWYYVADVAFYTEAVQYYEREFPTKNLTFVVASDDREWVTHNLANITHQSSVVFSPFKSPIEDMALLAQCNHTILSTGTFGRWAAWFSGGHVVKGVLCDPKNKTNICMAHIPAWRR